MARKMKLGCSGYTIERSLKHSGTQFLDLEIRLIPDEDGRSENMPRINWQGESDGGNRGEWYGCTMKVQSYIPEAFTMAAKIAAAVGMGYYGVKPTVVLENLEKLGLHRMVYDERVNAWVEPKDLLPPEVLAWRDDWEKIGEDSATAGALCATEEEARTKIGQELMRLLSDGFPCRTAQVLKAWIDAGRPVKALRYTHNPVEPLEDLLFLPKPQEEAEEVPAEEEVAV